MTQTTTQKELRILLLEDSPTDAELVELELRRAGMNFISQRVETQAAFALALSDFLPDIVLSDYNLPGFSGVDALEMVRRNYPATPVIFVTGALPDKDAANLMRLGAKDYVLKDRLARLAPAVQRALSVEHGVRIRKLTEAQLQEKTELLENVINSSLDYIFVKDRKLRTILCNAIFARALGKKPDELYGKTDIENGWDPELVKGNPEKGIHGFEQGDLAALAGNVVHSTSDQGNVLGEIRHFDSVKVPLKSADGHIFGILGISRDVTERNQAEEALRRYARDMNERVKEMSCLNDVITMSLIKDLSIEQLLDKCVRRMPDAWLEPQHTCARIRLGNQVFESPNFIETEWKLAADIPLAANESGTVEVYYKGETNEDIRNPFLDEERALTHSIAMQLGMSLERRRVEERLILTAKVFENTMEGITITDKDNNILEVNDAFTRITGYSRDEVVGKTPRILKSGLHDQDFYAEMWQTINTSGHWRGDIWNRRKDGEVYPESLTVSAITDNKGKVTNYVGIFADITLLKQHEKQLEHIAHFDALTGIPNRVLLADRMKQAIAFSKREKKLLAVCYLDLDGFKAINDSMGHEAGDMVLIEISTRIKNAVREGDTVARLGGDEFVVLLTGLEAPEECATSLYRLLEAVAQPIFVNDKLFKLSASIGVALYPLDDEDPDILLRHADQAMYTAKQSGRNRYYLYDTERDQSTRTRHEFTKRIQEGLAKGEFELFFQPKVELRSGRPIGAEALIRWQHPERGLLSPAEFLPAIEDTQFDIEVGEWVIATALRRLLEWRQAGLDLELSINISAFHMQSPEFTEKLRQKLLHCHGLLPGRLQIEILETAALKDIVAATRIINSCRDFGVGFALDDFGTGYSSLSYLSNLPVDTLKIDQSFIRDMLDDKGDFAIVQGIVALSKAFNMKTVAEGVATDKCFNALLDMGCEIGQGYFIAYPMPIEDFLVWHKRKCSSLK
ncbi:MAG: EAL domain-containing protein [Gallionella sp.]|nr:EAL domain-containing protein [Gallionella sp.]